MEYPIWQLSTLGGGFWIALIATIHVYVAHFAVGGGLFLVLTEQAAYRTNNIHLLEWAKKHTKFFLLLTMVFGGVSGVAIWFTIALLAPEATIILIKQFVFGWAAEWVCFLGEIVALIIYYYTWNTMNRRDHVILGWLYFIFGWFSLFLINGIVGFMLTPGEWLQTKDFWDGFFNPSFWPSLVFRTFFSAACAGLFGFVTATRIPDEETRMLAVRSCSTWTILGVLAVIVSGWWYIAALPAPQYEMVMLKSHRVAGFMQWFWIFSLATIIGGLLLAIRAPKTISFPLALVVLLAGQGLFGSFEFIREAGRKPYLIWDTVYSTSILKAHMPTINQNGAIASAKWAPPELKDGITETNWKQAGAFLYQLECSACHSIGGPMNDIRKRTAMFNTDGLDAMLTGMGKLNTYMPPFAGKPDERLTLARYITEELNGTPPSDPTERPELAAVEPVEFGADSSEYVLTAWCARGAGFYAQNDTWTLLPPSNTLRAQLILRGPGPERVLEDVTITYQVEDGFTGEPLSGTMELNEESKRFEAKLAIESRMNGAYNPLPVVALEARDTAGEILATAKVALPTSDQMGCRNCHGGDWAEGTSGVDSATVEHILAVHDRTNRTDLADRSGTIECASCHDDPIQGTDGKDSRLNLSAAIHGIHAVYLADREAENSCLKCHPVSTLRGQHDLVGFVCTDCHGTMEDHAISLLKAEQAQAVPGADRLLQLIVPRTVGNQDAINPRTPWLNQPDCLTCHVDFQAPETDSAFNSWTDDPNALYAARRDEMDSMGCGACHGSPHAIYPASDRDNVMPLQYMDEAQAFGANGSCAVCHGEPMDDAAHHPGMGVE
ncbi:cytochrome BD ubiquinol oxidase subunit I [Pseudodesulfovibrio sp. JC047]|uniref:cytochrome ubiquinol oxidase subunit I n=1 Tax=Pseudodesulfovibrio sp. JC047 TaxID=2683199 RepID=UPI0013D8CD7A|nr:cytochrome ubiquinol oxidase subunit I [Pseudodesulfovibrio sp. JC047]NDV20505.1 cytochrome BD ubiquinol oxidase subunit I [Pseudodesulfovibrio sp. JC047]